MVTNGGALRPPNPLTSGGPLDRTCARGRVGPIFLPKNLRMRVHNRVINQLLDI